MMFYQKALRAHMVCVLISVCLYSIPSYSQSNMQTPVTIHADGRTLREVFKELEQKTGFTINYQDNLVDAGKKIKLRVNEQPFAKVLQQLLAGTGITFKQQNSMIMLIRKPQQQSPVKKDTGRVYGIIIDEENGQPVASATIQIGSRSFTADIDGAFALALAEGNYMATISNVGYGTKQITDIEVENNRALELNITLKRNRDNLSAVVVKASARKESVASFYVRQKNNAAMSDGISAEQIRATPDNNAAQVLKRISGLTVQDDKFVTVRGLSERYNNVLLNGANLPGTEPNRKNFSFDIVPSALINDIVVNKTATPDLSAEFAGGLVQINMRDVPSDNIGSVTIGSGFNTNSTGKSLYSTPRGNREFLAADDGRRTWWEKSWSRDLYRTYSTQGNNIKTSEMNAYIPNNWGLRQYNYTPVQNYQLGLGKKFNIKDSSSLSVTLAGTYRHEETVVDDLRYQPSYYYYDSANTYEFITAMGGIANISFQSKGNKIVFRNLYNRKFSHESAVNYGKEFNYRVNTNEEGDDVLYYSDIVLINTLVQQRLEGEHQLGSRFKVDWSADYATLRRDQPDTRSSIGFQGFGPKGYYQYILNDAAGFINRGNAIFNSKLTEKRKNAAVNFSMPFSTGKTEHLLKAGYAGSFRKADFKSTAMRLLYDTKGNSDSINAAVFGLADYQLQTLLRPGYLTYRAVAISATDDGEDYNGNQELHAAYLMTRLNILRKLHLTGGVRMENNSMDIHGISYTKSTGMPVDTLVQYRRTDWLPSANLIYNLNTSMNIRFAYSKTLARADFRERSAFIYYDFRDRTTYRGALALKDAKITNVDLRYEYYPGPGEVVAVSAFYKKFNSPVEIVASNSGSQISLFYFNLDESTNMGVEADFRKSLGFISSSKWLSKIFVSGNASWMKGEVVYNPGALLAAAADAGAAPGQAPSGKRDRPLQGLSPYVINGGIGYFGNIIGINAVYNRFGKRILNAGFNPWQDQYENSRDVIDVQLSASLFSKKLLVRLNISDLLQQDYIVYQNVKATSPVNLGGGAFEHGSAEEQASSDNSNHDPKGTSFNKDLDFVYHKWFKGRNLSLNLTYSF